MSEYANAANMARYAGNLLTRVCRAVAVMESEVSDCESILEDCSEGEREYNNGYRDAITHVLTMLGVR